VPPGHRNDTVVVALSPDPLDKFKDPIREVSAKTGGVFVTTLLSDPEHKVIDLYGLRNVEAAAQGDLLPYATTYVLDSAGKVRWRFTEKNQAVRPTNEMILAELKKLW
jgi:peroxiredoxin